MVMVRGQVRISSAASFSDNGDDGRAFAIHLT